MNEKLCVFCKHFLFDSGWGGTDVTAGDPQEISCRVDAQEYMNGMYLTEGDFRDWILYANECNRYEGMG